MKRLTTIFVFSFAAFLIVAVALRVAGAVYWDARCRHAAGDATETAADGGSPAFHFGDSLSYHTLGKAIAFGEPYEYTEDRFAIFRTPGYPALLAPVFRLFGPAPPTLAFRLENVLFSVVGILLAAWWAWRIAGGKCFIAPVFVVAVLAVSPGAVASAFLVLTEAAFVPWMLGALILWDAALRRAAGGVSTTPDSSVRIGSEATIRTEFPQRRGSDREKSLKGGVGGNFLQKVSSPHLRRFQKPFSDFLRSPFFFSVLSGAVSGVAALIRPSWAIFPPMAAAFFILVGAGIPRRRHVVVALGIGLGMAVAMAPWWWRCAELTGRFIPTTLQTGTSLLDAWNPDADGSSRWEPVQREIDARRAEFVRDHGYAPGDAAATPSERIAFEMDMNDACGQVARRWAAENPGRVAWLAVRKFGRLWNPIPNEAAFRSWPVLIASLFLYLPVVAGAGFVVFRTFFRPATPLRSAAVPAGSAAGAVVVASSTRISVLLCALPIVYFTAIHMVFVSSIRYREPLVPLMAVLAAQGACAMWGGRDAGEKRDAGAEYGR